jgi:hypothetical protein
MNRWASSQGFIIKASFFNVNRSKFADIPYVLWTQGAPSRGRHGRAKSTDEFWNESSISLIFAAEID